MQMDEIQISDDVKFPINFMTAAYNQVTTYAEIYIETKRLPLDSLINHFERIGAKSTTVVPFSVNWRSQSKKTLERVIWLGKQPDHVFIQRGVGPKAAALANPKLHAAIAGVYVLRMDNKPTAFFYVGKATNIEHRIQQHANGTGAFCITGEPFTRVDSVTKGSTDDMESWERNEVLTLMFEFGINNVRGWMYTLKNMPPEQKVSAFDQICEKFDRCRKCGRGTHFVRDCQALSADLWTCGMELRTAYCAQVIPDASTQVALVDAERRIAEATRVLTAVVP